MQSDFWDVAILGGGLAGLSLAVQLKLRMPELSVAVVERNPHPVPEAAHKVGESLVELSTYYFAEVLGLREHLDKAQLPKLGLRFFFHTRQEALKSYRRFEDCVELGANQFPPSPSYQIDRGIFENFLGEYCRELGVSFLDNTRVTDVELCSLEGAKKQDQTHFIQVEDRASKERKTLSAKWVVDASSRASLIKKKLGLEKDSTHKVSAAWFRISDRVDISDWSERTDWTTKHDGDNSRWFSTNHLMGEGYWVWLIPLASGSTSIGIVADNEIHPLETYNTMEKALEWLERHEPAGAEKIKSELDKLQDFRFLRNFSHSAQQVYSKDRWYLTGEAGAFLDPFYSPGSDIIAMSNTFVTNIIEADNKGEDVNGMTFILNTFYLNICDNTNRIYQDKYAMFGNPAVMTTKILWDFAVYWSFTAFLYIQGKFFDFNKLFQLRKQFEYLGELNKEMQAFFIEWNQQPFSQCQPQYIDPFQIPFLQALNQGLYVPLSDDEFAEKFAENIENLKLLARDIMMSAADYHQPLSGVIEQSPLIKSLPNDYSVENNRFAEVIASFVQR